jgi:Lysyl oxidase
MPRPLLRSAVVAAVVVALAPASGPAAPPARERLPDLDQETPTQLDVAVMGAGKRPDYRLGFRSAVRNVGDGPLIIDGHRDGRQTPTMVADQRIDRDGAPQMIVPDRARMRYVRAPDHQHWHVLGFERYELRRAGSTRALVRDRKSGFCLGDRYQSTGRVLPAAASAAVYTSRCGLTHPELLHVREGISVGYGDDYRAHIEFQDLPLDGLPNGRYVLVHRVNVDRRLKEISYANDAASVLLDLRWRDGKPFVRELRTCPDSARCDRLMARAATTEPVRVAPQDKPFLCPLLRGA